MLSSDDPVRVFQRFATLDALSNGRAEVILGRGSFIESFPLFGFELNQYQELFEEKLDLFAALLPQEPVTWTGELRPPLTDQLVYPPVEHGRLKTWVGVGGSPESVVRAAHYGLPLVLAIIGGSPARFAPLADLYRRALEQFGNPLQPVAIHSPGFIADTDARGARHALAALQGHHRPDRPRARLGPGRPASTSRTRPGRTARSTRDRPRRSRRRSPRPCAPSAPRAST